MVSLHSLNNKFSKFSRLTLSEKCAFITYLIIFPLFLLVYRTIGYNKARKFTDYLVKPTKDSLKITGKELLNHSKIINTSLGNCIIKSTCLEKSLFTYLVLGLKGFNSDLKIGINNDENKFQAHAWVEKEQIVLNDQQDSVENFSAF